MGTSKKLLEIAQEPAAHRVLIADRDSMTGDMLANVLRSNLGYHASTIPQSKLLDELGGNDLSLLIIAADTDSRVGGGLELTRQVSNAFPELPILVIHDRSTYELVVLGFRAGARGVFSRQQPMSEFFDCVEHVRKGFIWSGEKETGYLLQAFRQMPAPRLGSTNETNALTARQLQVVRCAAMGKTNKVIAAELSLSEHTVKNYLFQAFEKIGVSSRVELLFHLTTREPDVVVA